MNKFYITLTLAQYNFDILMISDLNTLTHIHQTATDKVSPDKTTFDISELNSALHCPFRDIGSTQSNRSWASHMIK